MAVTAPGMLADFSGWLTREESLPIFQRAYRTSILQRLVQQQPLGARGQQIPIFGKLTAGWVGEGAAKPAASMPFSMKTMDPKKLAIIVPVSREVVRQDPAGFMTRVQLAVGEAFGRAFDLAGMFDQGGDGTAGAGPFSTYLSQTSSSVELGTATTAAGGVRADLIAALSVLVAGGKKLTGFALDERIEPYLLGAVDTTGAPIWRERELADVPEEELLGAVRSGALLNRRSWMGEGLYSGAATDIVGFAGDFTQAAWGAVAGIEWAISTEAAVTINGALVSLWENNLVALRAEAEYGWLVNDTASFVKLLDAA